MLALERGRAIWIYSALLPYINISGQKVLVFNSLHDGFAGKKK
jgi:hypothetical protein